MRKSGIVTGRTRTRLRIRLEAEFLPPASCGAVKDIGSEKPVSCASCSSGCGSAAAPGGRVLELPVRDLGAFADGDRVSVEMRAGGAALGLLIKVGLPLALAIGASFLLPAPRWPLAFLAAVPAFAAAAFGISLLLARLGVEPGMTVVRAGPGV